MCKSCLTLGVDGTCVGAGIVVAALPNPAPFNQTLMFSLAGAGPGEAAPPATEGLSEGSGGEVDERREQAFLPSDAASARPAPPPQRAAFEAQRAVDAGTGPTLLKEEPAVSLLLPDGNTQGQAPASGGEGAADATATVLRSSGCGEPAKAAALPSDAPPRVPTQQEAASPQQQAASEQPSDAPPPVHAQQQQQQQQEAAPLPEAASQQPSEAPSPVPSQQPAAAPLPQATSEQPTADTPPLSQHQHQQQQPAVAAAAAAGVGRTLQRRCLRSFAARCASLFRENGVRAAMPASRQASDEQLTAGLTAWLGPAVLGDLQARAAAGALLCMHD